MDQNEKRTVYLLSGPAGVGKSTTSRKLVNQLSRSAYLSGDDISEMHVNGRKMPWESEEELSLIWNNIASLARNFLSHGTDVVIDYVAFPADAKWLFENLGDLQPNLVYVVLWTDKETLRQRDALRSPDERMGERCLVLLDEFAQSGLEERHIFHTSGRSIDELDDIIGEIMNNPRFKINAAAT